MSSGPRFIEPPEPPVSTPLYRSMGHSSRNVAFALYSLTLHRLYQYQSVTLILADVLARVIHGYLS